MYCSKTAIHKFDVLALDLAPFPAPNSALVVRSSVMLV